MHLPEPPPTRWELRGRLFRVPFRIRPLFWVSCVLPGVVYYQYPAIREKIGGLTAFGLWLAAVLLSLLVHETGHVFAARLFGAPARIVLSGFGGQMFGLEQLRPWRRSLIALAGPLANLLLVAVLWLILPVLPVTDWLGFLVQIGLTINVFWGLLNLLPLWPLDGGRIAVEIGAALLGRRGQKLALLLSLAVSLLLTINAIVWMRVTLINPFDPRYPVYLTHFCVLALYCYAFWLSAFRALWGDSPPPDATTGQP